MKFKNTIKYVIIVIIIIFYMASLVAKEFQNDTFFTIAIGENILENGVEKEEKLVWHEGLEFTNPRWLFDLMIATIYNQIGFLGIYLTVIVVAIFQGLLYYYIINKITKKTYLSLFITLIVMYINQNEFTARAQIISFSIFLIEFYCIEELIKTNKNSFLLVLCILPVFLVNLHSSVYPMYFVLLLPYVAEYILEKVPLKKNEKSKIVTDNYSIKKLIIVILIAIISGFITPDSLEPYSYMFKNMNGFSKTFISELQNVNLTQFVYFTIFMMFIISIMIFSKVKIKLRDGLFILGFFLMALNANRCVFFFYLISTICIIRTFDNFIELYKINISFLNYKLKNIILCLLILCIFTSSLSNIFKKINSKYVKATDYPIDLAEYILNNLEVQDMKIYNSFNFGSYLEFKGIPVFIDSRSEMYTEEFNPRNNNSTRLV